MRASLTPARNLVQVKLIAPETMTAGGLHIPETAQRKNDYAKVVAVGKGTRLKDGSYLPLPIKPGDTIVVDTTYLMRLRRNGEELQFIRDEDIGAVVEDD
jgi:chaperonin GroES